MPVALGRAEMVPPAAVMLVRDEAKAARCNGGTDCKWK